MSDHFEDAPCYFGGEIVPLSKAMISVRTHALQYGTAVIGGIRGYYNPQSDNIYLFRIRDHYQRLLASGKILQMKSAPSVDELIGVTIELLRQGNWRRNVYLRPFLYKSELALSPRLHNVEDDICIYAIPLDDYLDTRRGLTTCVSSWVRVHETQVPMRAKATGTYLNSALAKSEALEHGYDEAIFLDIHGNVSEGSAENIFMVRDGVIITPDTTSSVLEGITRRTIIELAHKMGYTVIERQIARSELYTADELFFSGTGVQVAWIASVDRRLVGSGQIGPVTSKLQTAFFDLVNGREPAWSHWLTPVYDVSGR